MCGGISAQLRMCGHDAAFALDRDLEADADLLAVAREEDRILVTRNRRLAARADESILLEATDPAEQLEALAAGGIDLSLSEDPERCGRCNGPLSAVEPTDPTPEYAPDPAAEAVWACADCGQHFWKGSHWDRVEEGLPEG